MIQKLLYNLHINESNSINISLNYSQVKKQITRRRKNKLRSETQTWANKSIKMFTMQIKGTEMSSTTIKS